jgi:hypothetical protein
MIDFLEKSSSMSSDTLEINFGVRTEIDVSVVPSDVICIMCVVISVLLQSLDDRTGTDKTNLRGSLYPERQISQPDNRGQHGSAPAHLSSVMWYEVIKHK